jgi:hypothetical protein
MQYCFSFSAWRCSSVVVLSKEGRKKKSLETGLWMAIWSWGSPTHCCQPAVAGGFIYADLRSELNTHPALQALFTQSSPVCEPLLQAFPFPSTLGEVTLHLLSQAGVFLYVGSGSSPLSCGVFLLPPLLQAFPLLVAGRVPLLLPSQAGLLIYNSVRDFPFPSSSTLLCAPPPLLCVFFVVIAYYPVFFLFSLGGGRSVQGAMLIWRRIVCGSTECHLTHLVVRVFPSHLGTGLWWRCGRPLGFSV